MATAMTPDEIKARLDEIQSRMTEIDSDHAGKALPDELRSEFESLVSERKELQRLEKELEARREVIEEAAEQPESRERGFEVRKPRARGEDIYDLSTVRSAVNSPEEATRELTERAKYAIEHGNFAADSIDPDEARANAERLLKSKDTKQGDLARRMLETGSPLYERAFGKALVGTPLNDAETRALSTTDANGGYAIPFTLDPTVIHTSNQSVNPFRAISRVVQVTTDNWNGITSAGVSASYKAEAAEANDDSPTLSQPSIHPERADCFVPYSIEVGQDWSGLQAEITGMIQEAKDDLEATKFATGAGSGSNEPFGLFTGATVSLNTAGTATFAVADLYSAEAALPPRHRPRAQWVANRIIYGKVRQFDTNGGASLWTENLQKGLANNVPTSGNTGYDLLGYPANELSTMGTTTATGGTLAVLGNFSRFVIVDRIGMNVELIPHLFHTANNRPSGQRGLFAVWRNSSKVIDPNAFRVLKSL